MEKNEASGRCLCGETSFIVENIANNVGICHCNMCRRWGGGPLFAVDCGTEVSFDGAGNVSVYDSSDWAERGFCRKCGTHLFYRLKASQQYIMPVGLFQDHEGFVLDHQIFVDEKPHYYNFSNKTEEMTGAEVFAKYAPPSD